MEQLDKSRLAADAVYTLNQCAALLNRSRSYVARIIAARRLRASRDDAGYLIRGSDVIEYIDSCLVK